MKLILGYGLAKRNQKKNDYFLVIKGQIEQNLIKNIWISKSNDSKHMH